MEESKQYTNDSFKSFIIDMVDQFTQAISEEMSTMINKKYNINSTADEINKLFLTSNFVSKIGLTNNNNTNANYKKTSEKKKEPVKKQATSTGSNTQLVNTLYVEPSGENKDKCGRQIKKRNGSVEACGKLNITQYGYCLTCIKKCQGVKKLFEDKGIDIDSIEIVKTAAKKAPVKSKSDNKDKEIIPEVKINEENSLLVYGKKKNIYYSFDPQNNRKLVIFNDVNGQEDCQNLKIICEEKDGELTGVDKNDEYIINKVNNSQGSLSIDDNVLNNEQIIIDDEEEDDQSNDLIQQNDNEVDEIK